MFQDLLEDDRVAVCDWKSPELVLNDENPNTFLADETAHHGLAGCKNIAAGAECFLDCPLAHPIFLLICRNLERERVMLL
jgi:hypothetical protein